MKEDFLHFVWKEQLFNSSDLKTTDGRELTIVDNGKYNFESGPDFFNCRIKLDGIVWAGNIEIHVRASDWYRHNHQEDHAYHNVILHVVYDYDMEVRNKSGHPIPTISLKNRFYQESYLRYKRFFESNSMIYPCMPKLKTINNNIIEEVLLKSLHERLQTKSNIIYDQLHLTKNNWEESFYHLLAKSFGFNTNAIPLQLLAETIPLTIIERESNELIKIESLLFGVAGLLNNEQDIPYLSKLKTSFKYQQIKYNLAALHPAIWKFGKLRPSNFPTIRIAQLAMLLYKRKRIFKQCINANSIDQLRNLFSTEASEFWSSHFHFESASKPSLKQLGEDSINSLILNLVAPFCYTYGNHIGKIEIQMKATEWLLLLPPEKNKYTKSWNDNFYTFTNAAETQGLIQLNKFYCSNNRCIHCKIGCSILNISNNHV